MNKNLAPLITWLPSRSQVDLNGAWRSIIDVYDVGITGPFGRDDGETAGNPNWGFAYDRGRNSPGRSEYDFDTSPEIEVPGDWNTQHERFHFYEGSMWFRRHFDTPDVATGRRLFVHFGAVNHQAVVFLNGKRLAQHEGGFGPFCVEVTDALAPAGANNALIVRVNNRREPHGIPTTRTDWFNYGGLTRDVTLVDVPSTFVRDAVVQLVPDDPTLIEATVWLDGDDASQDVEILVDGVTIGSVRTDADGHGSARFAVPEGLVLWTPADPVLYDVAVRSATDEVRDRIGFRTITTSGSTILLNGQPVFLAGIALHDEAIGSNTHRVQNRQQALELLGHAKDLGSVFVRLAHYQHNEHTVRACDELGLLAWCELPVYWGIDWDNESTLANGKDQLTELIVRDRNRAAVVLWSVANETRPVENRNRFLRSLIAHARTLDPTRLISAALFARPVDGDMMSVFKGEVTSDWIIDDPLGEDLDVLGVNQYLGWYYGSVESMASIEWTTPFDKPLIITEFGGGARRGLRGEVDESWTEDMQAEIYRHQFEMLGRIPFLAGTSPWILKDFRAPFRLLPQVQDGYNRKGLIDHEGNRKLAFDVVAEWNRDRSGST
ncbi:MAG: glycoside hydrolase family 2 TIM barrel-domain containing protein [Acidimicrobiales bacterium]